MKLLVLCSQAKNTGARLRALYIYKYLRKLEPLTEYIEPPLKSMPFMMDFVFSMVYYFFALMNRKYDAVIIVKPYPNTVLPALMLKAGGARIIIDIDDLDYGYRKGALSAFIKFIQEKLIKYADSLTSHNAELVKMIEKEDPARKGKVYILKQAVDTGFFDIKRASRRRVMEIKAEYKGKTILFYMAHLNIASYLEDIMEALVYIKDKNTILLVAGGGPLLNHYRKLASSIKAAAGRVYFLGPLGQEEAVNYATASEVCLVYYSNSPVNKYRSSMKLREYLALSKKVAAPAVGEIKKFRGCVFLSPPSKQGFAGAVRKAIKSLDKREKKGYKLVMEQYNWGREIKAFYKHLKAELKNG